MILNDVRSMRLHLQVGAKNTSGHPLSKSEVEAIEQSLHGRRLVALVLIWLITS